MTLRINAELYEQLKWAVGLRPDLSMADVVRLAMNWHNYSGRIITGTGPGEIVLNIDFRGMADCLTHQQIRDVIGGYLAEQMEKVESRQPVPLDLEPCASYTVGSVQ